MGQIRDFLKISFSKPTFWRKYTETDLKKSQIGPIWRQSDLICVQSQHPWSNKHYSLLAGLGQLSLKKWLLPNRKRSPCLTLCLVLTTDPLTQVLASSSGVRKISLFSASTTACCGWMPSPDSWMSCSLGASALPTKVCS